MAKYAREIHPKWNRRFLVSNQTSRTLAGVGRRGTEEGVRIQVNSDKNVRVDTRVTQFVRSEVNRYLKRFGSKLTEWRST